ncbi:chorismate transformation enzyme, FkbO/Hyg5 family [Asaia astilbis]|uniref:chorismate transformation enzyme, FkbO/Hyg5 family n=1 Tax=Asaia astilbis TaxID=610244 RepID=UPI0004710AF8|nr:hypothetical protein [Asaia astilbis]
MIDDKGHPVPWQSANHVLLPHYNLGDPKESPCLALVKYSSENSYINLEDDVLVFSIPSQGNHCTEYWRSDLRSDSVNKKSGRFANGAWTSDGDNLFIAAYLEDRDILTDSVQALYEGVLRLVEAQGYRSIYRIWNYIGKINEANSQGLERYRDFSQGRAIAFSDFGYSLDDLPAATAIGFGDGGLAVFLIAHKEALTVNLENPRQIPAFRYPTQYGPRSPSFARATMLHQRDRAILYVSGTASIIGHESIVSDLQTQIDNTKDNIEIIIDRARSEHEFERWSIQSLKVYYRDVLDLNYVRPAVLNAFALAETNVVFMRADICRSELDLEIEGIIEFF